MRINALAVANYFVEKAQEECKEIRLLGLIKRVYIAHGFSLAIHKRSLLDSRFDKVEAWRYGPVIPSVYHSFKHHGKNPIKERATLVRWDEDKEDILIETPKLESRDDKRICDMVWSRYQNYTDSDLVSLTHEKSTPWHFLYRDGQNIEIGDAYTEIYYKALIKEITGNDV